MPDESTNSASTEDRAPLVEVPGSAISGVAILAGALVVAGSAALFLAVSSELRYEPFSVRTALSYISVGAVAAGGIALMALGALLRDLRRLIWISSNSQQRRSFF